MSTIDEIPPQYREVLVDLLVRLGERVVQEVLKILRKPPGDLRELLADALADMQQSNYLEAIQILAKTLKHPLSYAARGTVMLVMAQCYNEIACWDETERCATEAAKNATKARSMPLYSAALSVKGVANAQRSQYATAESLFNEALSVASNASAADLQAVALTNLAALSLQRHDLITADELARRTYGLLRASNDVIGVGICLVNWSVADRRRAQAVASYNKLQKALFLFGQAGYVPGAADAMAGLGALSGEVGDFIGAEGYFRQSLELSRMTKSLHREALAYRGLARIELISDRVEKARHLYSKALNLSKQVGDRAAVGRINGELGIIADQMHKPKRAVKHFEEALSAFEEVNDRLGKAITLSNLGGVYSEMDRDGEAQAALREALAIQEQMDNKQGQVATLVSLGRVALKLGDTCAVEHVIREARSRLKHSVGFGPDLEVLSHSLDRLEEDAGLTAAHS